MSKDRVIGIVKDVASTLAIVAIILGTGFALTGTYPFMVAVESGSMVPNMHRGDVVFLISPDRTDIVTRNEGLDSDYSSFGDYGDVIIFKPDGDDDKTPVIHRAIAWVEEDAELPNGQTASHSGYLTQGDNNQVIDQPALTGPVKEDWIVGVAKLKVPVVGYFSLMFR
ncbi:MAG: S26 family signal peptidase [Archaeoglobaceae archaeon]